jgi:hypothetical protein
VSVEEMGMTVYRVRREMLVILVQRETRVNKEYREKKEIKGIQEIPVLLVLQHLYR